ncbi:MAG TPA: metalloregulator ArsR/SmtB family transcription factor [Solirubrobacteraceae bacterium]|nr:metalloregulator ArsR/SmtB family transcription factor [Solirubrobacteraceae bacterium]
MSDPIGPVFAALADPTRRMVVQSLLSEGTTSVPSLTAALPITRQAVAKHLAALDSAGLIERAPGAGREIRYRLRAGALAPAAGWMADTQAAWDSRLARLKTSVEAGGSGKRRRSAGAR